MPASISKSKKVKLWISITILSSIVFILDYSIPLGVAAGVPYAIVVLVSLNLNKSRSIQYVTLYCIFLTILGYYLSPTGGILWMVWSNRSLAILAISISAYLGIRMKKSELEIRKVADIPEENPNPVLRISYSYKVLYANQPARTLFNCNGDNTATITLPDHWENQILLIVENNRSVELEYSCPNSNKIISFHLTPVLNEKYINVYGTNITERKKSEKNLRKLSRTDALTGISNRRFFNESLSSEYQRAKRMKSNLSLILLDIDYFKKYNDTYGHQAGDAALRKIARVLASVSNRPGDVVARYGGEEFVILLPFTSLDGALLVAEEIRATIETKQLRHTKSNKGDYLTVSLGVVSALPDNKLKKKDFLEEADKALYNAKDHGRNCVVYNDKSIKNALTEKGITKVI